jgi:hypothetical protein
MSRRLAVMDRQPVRESRMVGESRIVRRRMQRPTERRGEKNSHF